MPRKAIPVGSAVGDRMMSYRKSHKLTQMELAERYKVSAPAIFKFEKGFIAPSLRLWLVISADMGIPEREAVLLWIRDRIPRRYHACLPVAPRLDIEQLREELETLSAQSNGRRQMRESLLHNPDVPPALKRFVASDNHWESLKPTAREIVFLVELDRVCPLVTLGQFREAMLCAREVQQPGD